MVLRYVTVTHRMQQELDVACRLARDAGALIVGYFGTGIAVDTKSNDEPVTLADRRASELIVSGLASAFPDDLVISEEAEPDLPRLASASRAWFVDPLDGTKEFIRGLNNFSVLIGLAIDGAPTLGVVYQPIGDILYRAAPGCSPQRISASATQALQASSQSDLAQLRLAVSESDRRPVLDDIKRRLGIQHERAMGSVGLKFCLLAAGESDVYINPTAGAKAWDTCASLAILRAAGGHASDVFGEPLLYQGPELRHTRGIVASNGALHSSVIATTRGTFASKTRLD